MNNSESFSNVAFVVASCDKYSDLWEPLFGQLFKHWAQIPYQIYLISNHKKFNHPRVVTLLAGDDLDWSSTVIQSINQIKEDYVLFWVDDAFLSQDVDNEHVKSLVTSFIDEKYNFLRMRPNPKPDSWLSNDLGVLSYNQAYRVSLFATLWNVSVLKEILRRGESAWQFEVDGTERSRQIENFFCTRDEVFKYLHGVERGVWILSAANKLKRMGYSIDKLKRPIMSYSNNLSLQYRLFKSWILHLIPGSQRNSALRYVRRMYKILGLR